MENALTVAVATPATFDRYPSDKEVMRVLACIGHVRLARLLNVQADEIGLQLAPYVFQKPLPDPAGMYQSDLHGRDL